MCQKIFPSFLALVLSLVSCAVFADEAQNLDFAKLDSAGLPADWTFSDADVKTSMEQETIAGRETRVLVIEFGPSEEPWNMLQKVKVSGEERKYELTGRMQCSEPDVIGLQVKVKAHKTELARANSEKAAPNWKNVRLNFSTKGATEFSIQFRAQRRGKAFTVKLADFKLTEVK